MRVSMALLSLVGLAVLPLAAACGSSPASPGGNPEGGTDTGHPTPEAGTPEGGHPQKDAGPDTGDRDTGKTDAGCADDVVPPRVTKDLTLTLACSPWHVHKPVQVGGKDSPVLTIEPGVTVLFDAATSLQVGGLMPGGLQAVGTKSLPITLTSSKAKPKGGDWASIWLQPQSLASSTMQYVTVEYAGGNISPLVNVPTDNAAIIVDGDTTPLQIELSNITVSKTGSSGIVFFGHQAGFAPSSGSITVTDWATGGYPIIIDGDDAETLPTSLTTGKSGHDGAIGIITQEGGTNGGAQTIIDHTQTWPSLQIPYAIDSYGFTVGGCGLFIDGSGTASATLTLAAPNTLLFGTPCGIYVDYMNEGQGLFVAPGTSANPIVFTSLNTTSPAAGDWDGIQFGHSATGQGGSSLDYCTISYAAGPTTDISPTGAVVSDMYLGSNTGPSITNSEFDHYALATTPMGGCCGIVAIDTANPGNYGTASAGANGNTFSPDGTALGDVCVEVE
jgi:hypothetical protein